MTGKKDGGVRLLHQDDLETKIVGWRRTSQGEGGLYNPGGFAMLRVVVQKLVNGELNDLYDQPMVFENPGSIVVCRMGMKVGMIQSFRMVGERLEQIDADYVRRLNDEERWSELLETLGHWRWELPRGIAPTNTDAKSLQELVLKVAKIESGEEAGFTIENAEVISRVNANPTFFGHAQFVVDATIKAVGKQRTEDLEIIGGVRLFNAHEISSMVDGEEIDGAGFDDGLSKAALADAKFHY